MSYVDKYCIGKIICRYDFPLPFNGHPSSRPRLWPSSSSEHPPLPSRCQYLPCQLISEQLLSLLSVWHFIFKVMLLPPKSLWVYQHFPAILGLQDLFWFFQDTCSVEFITSVESAKPSSLGSALQSHSRAVVLPMGLFGWIPCILISLFLILSISIK